MGSIPGLRRSPGGGILAWEIPWTEEPGGLQSMVLLQRVGHDCASCTKTYINVCFLKMSSCLSEFHHPLLSFIKTLVIGFRAYPNPV